MAQHFKYNTGATINNTTQKGNIAIASSGTYDWGPTSTTGYYPETTPPTGGYTIYYMRATGGPSIEVATTDAQCIFFLKSFGATGTTISDVLTWASNTANYYVQTGATTGIVTSGLTLNLDAGNVSSYPGSGTTWTDLSSTANNGTLFNSPTFDSANGGSIVFDGSVKYISLDASKIPTGNQVTLCFWSYGISKTTTNTIFNSEIATDHRTMNVHQVYTNSNVYWDAGDGAGSFVYDRINSSAISDAQYLGWHHWVYTKNASTGNMNVYLDNSLLITGTGKTLPLSTPSYATIGADRLNGLYFAGKIGIVNIYNRELSTSEISQNFNASRSRFGI